jgi:uncharacterized protein YgiB involved in biofilm formation
MSSTEAFAAHTPCARLPTLRVVSCVSLMSFSAFVNDAAAATLGKTYFFATRDACVSSGVFTVRECASAFSNAHAQLRDRAPRFAAGAECRLHFHICQLVPADPGPEDAMSYAPVEEPSYAPSALGVEMVASANGVEAAPTLAVETRERLFAYYPVSKVYEFEQEGRSEAARGDGNHERQNAAILSPDHFEPFSKRKPVAGATTFTASALGAIAASSGNESRDERRMRLRNAPFVE